MISLEHITVHFGERVLFDNLSCTISPHDRTGLVGANGAGKSTLLKIIAGMQPPDAGTANKAHYVTVGYLPQEGITAEGRTLYKEAETAFEDVMEVQRELDEALDNLNSLDPVSDEHAETVEIYGELQHKIEDLDTFRMKSKIETVLMGLGFSVSDFARETSEFSGGWQMRIALAKLLLKEPSLLLLDEPTNHLDIESLAWLEEYLRGYNGAVILVSHDRALLDSLTSKTYALSRGSLHEYAGNYSFYEKEKLVRRELLLQQQKNQQQQMKQTQQFIDRFRYKASKARQVQSRIKQMEKIEFIEIDDDEEEIRFEFPQPQQSGRVVMELKNISKSYGETRVFEGLHYKIERGDKIAVVGVNGAGKSTLSRILAGVEPVDAGERIIGYNVILSYFAQHQAEELELSKDALQIVDEVAQGEIRKKLRTILGSFLFHGDDVFKKVSVLSGGEKSRLALAKMLLQPANFLVMDEPTNHLDMRSKKVLQEALQRYVGSYVIVSHDRAFLDPIVNKVLEVRHGSVRTYLGNVSDYLRKKKDEREAGKIATRLAPKEKAAVIAESARGSNQGNVKKQQAKELKPLIKRLESAEKEIEMLEQRKAALETAMANPDLYQNADDARSTSTEYQEVETLLERAYSDWTGISDQMKQIEESFPLSP